MSVEMLGNGWGLFFKYKLLTETRSFDQVEKALHDSGIQEHHASPLLQRPKPATAFTRSMGYLIRVCAASIPFAAGSPNASWDENGVTVTADRNPNYSLKIESVKGTNEGEIAYRINISDRRSRDENMAHVLTATYRPDKPVEIVSGEVGAWNKFGEDLAKLVNEAYTKFFSNYDDTDVRDVIVKELGSLAAVNVLGKTTNFIAKDTDARPHNTERAERLNKFVHDCGHLGNMLGLDSTNMTRDAIVDELRTSIMSQLEEAEDKLDEKLGQKTKERERGEKQRLRMKNTAEMNVDSVMALAEYHAQVLGVMAEGIVEKAAAIKAKAAEFLTKDFGTGVPTVKPQAAADGSVVTDLEKKIAQLEAENARLKAFQGVSVVSNGHAEVAAPVVIPPQAAEVVANGADPFAS